MADNEAIPATDVMNEVESEPAVPDYLCSPDAVLSDKDVDWRHGKPPNYSKTRKVWAETKQMNHAAGSLPQLVENLVKNWEIEASFKTRLQDWRTIDHSTYTFTMNGGAAQSADHMLDVGTYNAILTSSEYYCPKYSDLAASHKTFKNMMPTFAWEVLEVYSGPPTVAFKWRHWGQMLSDYVAFNGQGEKVTANAHGGPIEIFGVSVAKVDDQIRIQSIETWMDPLAMFRQIMPDGTVHTEAIHGLSGVTNLGEANENGDGSHVHSADKNGEKKGDQSDVVVKIVSETAEHLVNGVSSASGACPMLKKLSPIGEQIAPQDLSNGGYLGSNANHAEITAQHLLESDQPESERSCSSLSSQVATPESTGLEFGLEKTSGKINAGQEDAVEIETGDPYMDENMKAAPESKRPKLDDSDQDVNGHAEMLIEPLCMVPPQPDGIGASSFSLDTNGNLEEIMETDGFEKVVGPLASAGIPEVVDQPTQNGTFEDTFDSNIADDAAITDAVAFEAAPSAKEETHQATT